MHLPPRAESLQWVTAQMRLVPTAGPANMLEPEQWNSALSSITGTVVRGVERIATKDVLAILGLEQRETKRLAQAMRLHGWSGPKSMRFTITASS